MSVSPPAAEEGSGTVPGVEVEVCRYLLRRLRKVRERSADVTPGIVGGETAHLVVADISWRGACGREGRQLVQYPQLIASTSQLDYCAQ